MGKKRWQPTNPTHWHPGAILHILVFRKCPILSRYSQTTRRRGYLATTTSYFRQLFHVNARCGYYQKTNRTCVTEYGRCRGISQHSTLLFRMLISQTTTNERDGKKNPKEMETSLKKRVYYIPTTSKFVLYSIFTFVFPSAVRSPIGTAILAHLLHIDTGYHSFISDSAKAAIRVSKRAP